MTSWSTRDAAGTPSADAIEVAQTATIPSAMRMDTSRSTGGLSAESTSAGVRSMS